MYIYKYLSIIITHSLSHTCTCMCVCMYVWELICLFWNYIITANLFIALAHFSRSFTQPPHRAPGGFRFLEHKFIASFLHIFAFISLLSQNFLRFSNLRHFLRMPKHIEVSFSLKENKYVINTHRSLERASQRRGERIT